jgi:chromosome segregation ATPase
MRKVKEIDDKIAQKKDKIQLLNSNSKSLNNEHKKNLNNKISELKRKISLLEVEFDVVKKYKNTYRMNEIKDEIINKKYKIQSINDELASFEKDKINGYELQINTLKKYVAELEDENLNDVYDSNEFIYQKNELQIKNNNKEIEKLKEKIKKINTDQIDNQNKEIKKVIEKLNDLERSYNILKGSQNQRPSDLKAIERNVNNEKQKLNKFRANLVELKNKEIFDTNLDIEYHRSKLDKLNDFYKKANILKNKFKIEKISEMIKKYKKSATLLNEHAIKLKINNENRIEREIDHIYNKLDKLNLFRKKAMIDHNKYAVQSTSIIIEDERDKLAKLTLELHEIRKEKDFQLQREIDSVYNRIRVLAIEYQKAKKNNDKQKMTLIEKEEDILNPKLKKLDNEYFKLRTVEKNRMKAEIDYLNRKMNELEDNVDIGNKAQNKIRIQELARELNQKRNDYSKYSLLGMKRLSK